MNLKNKWVWVTGASSGIGRALAIECSKYECNLVLMSRNEAQLQETAANLSNTNGRNLIQVLDLENSDSIHEAVNALKAQNIPIDVLINCGGISQRSLALDTPEAVERKIFEVDYFGTILITKLVLPVMMARGGGQIVTVTSLVGIIGSPKRTSYSASKHALHGFFDSLRAELYHDNIRVTLVCPGFIRTNISYSALTAQGIPQNTMDQKTDDGMNPDVLAIKTVKGIIREREEIYVGGKEILAIYLKRFVPSIFSRILRNAKVT